MSIFLCDLSFRHIFAFANVTKEPVTIQKFIVRIISLADYHMVSIIGWSVYLLLYVQCSMAK